mgnify:CR=1 FL=1
MFSPEKAEFCTHVSLASVLLTRVSELHLFTWNLIPCWNQILKLKFARSAGAFVDRIDRLSQEREGGWAAIAWSMSVLPCFDRARRRRTFWKEEELTPSLSHHVLTTVCCSAISSFTCMEYAGHFKKYSLSFLICLNMTTFHGILPSRLIRHVGNVSWLSNLRRIWKFKDVW